MIIRPGRARDAEAIAAFWNPMIRDTAVTFNSLDKTPAQIAADISARGAGFQVAEEAGQVIGFATYFPFRSGPGYAHTRENTIILAPRAQGRGLGRALMQALARAARAEGIHVLIAGVSAENPAGVAFHEAIGFARIATLPQVGRKFDRWMDLVLLQRLL